MACSVFPDQALVPGALTGDSGAGGALSGDGGAGEPVEPTAGEPSVAPGGRAAAGGSEPGGGAGGSGGRAAPSAGAGGVESVAGGGGSGGSVTQSCATPKSYVANTTLDLWIGAGQATVNHGSELILSVNGGSDERRALFAVTIPVAPEGTVLLSAEVALQLEANADEGKAARRLGLFLLQPLAVDESEANWRRYAKGNARWNSEGGDLGEQISEMTVPAGTSSGLVRFDVTERVRAVLGAAASSYVLVLLELGTPLTAPSALTFTSREGNASRAPSLLLSYCE
jgi:hypothetical protein